MTRISNATAGVFDEGLVTTESAIDSYHLTPGILTGKDGFDGFRKMNASTLPPAFQLVAGHPILDFVNTLDWRFREEGSEELLKSYDDLLRFAEQSMLLSSSQAKRVRRAAKTGTADLVLARCIELREATAQVLYSILNERNPSSTQMKILERHFKEMHLHRSLDWKNAQMEWGFSEVKDLVELPLWLLSLSTSDLMVSEQMLRLRSCDNQKCNWLFLDTSKNHTRRWCDMKICGNRMKARRFKAQHRGVSS